MSYTELIRSRIRTTICIAKDTVQIITDIDARLSLQEKLIKSYGDKYVISKEWDDKVLKLGKAKELSQEMVDAFISKVIVYQDGQLGIT